MTWWTAIPNGKGRPLFFRVEGMLPFEAHEAAGMGLGLKSAYRTREWDGMTEGLVKSHSVVAFGREIQFWHERLAL
ncbi:MAG: hypothetical protein KGL39_11355 [Patescibacteria group bacterium]|nr:hypothetical protein [Patescibacteria group bacterium]